LYTIRANQIGLLLLYIKYLLKIMTKRKKNSKNYCCCCCYYYYYYYNR